MKEIIKKLALLSCLLGSLFVVSNNALAGDGWSGSGGDTDFGGGGDGSGCTGENPDFRIDCSGVSWLKYNFVGKKSEEYKSGNVKINVYKVGPGETKKIYVKLKTNSIPLDKTETPISLIATSNYNGNSYT